MPVNPSKTVKKPKKNLWLGIAAGALVVASGTTWALWPKDYSKLANELAQKGPEEIRKAVDSGQLPREAARDAFESAREMEMQKRMDGFFALKSGVDRNKYLDKMIDEQQTRMREWQQRATTRPARAEGERRRDDGPQTRPSEAQRAAWAKERDARRDAQPPERKAQRAEFMAAMMQRMKERGMQMPNGGRGFGGPGGGPGGGRGGDGPRGGGR